MKILVLAANGRTGREVVTAAVENGHSVSVFIRSKKQLPASFDSLQLFIGDVTNYSDIADALLNQDVIISTLGHNKNSQKDVQQSAITNLLKAAEKINPKLKIVSLTGTGVRQSDDKITLLDKLLNLAVTIFDKQRLVDGRLHVEQLKESGINWSVVRVLKLTNSNSPPRTRLTPHGPAKILVSRKETALALLEVAETSGWDRTMPVVSPKR